jgi:hypothetical protein
MGSRERQREERRKRKRRSAERAPAPSQAAVPSGEAQPQQSFQDRMSSKSEQRNEAVRRTLEPLQKDERPGVVTVAAIVAGVLAIVLTVSAVLAAAGVEVGDREAPRALPIAIFAAALWLMTWGLWKARYWAVLGFQMLLVLVLLASGLGLVQVETVLQAVGTLALLAGSGALFYFMIRAMARIQMPQSPGEG